MNHNSIQELLNCMETIESMSNITLNKSIFASRTLLTDEIIDYYEKRKIHISVIGKTENFYNNRTEPARSGIMTDCTERNEIEEKLISEEFLDEIYNNSRGRQKCENCCARKICLGLRAQNSYIDTDKITGGSELVCALCRVLYEDMLKTSHTYEQ